MSGLEDFQPRRGIIVDFDLNPIKGSETGKIRPCVVVTNNIYNQKLSVIQVVPLTAWTAKKELIITNVTVNKTAKNGLSKKSIADCLQTRPIDYPSRYVRSRGKLTTKEMEQINQALKIIFALN